MLSGKKRFSPLLALALALQGLVAQPQGAVESRLALARLSSPASVLMIAAHPDDEYTPLLAYFASGRNVRTGYLSLTRGEGGQNLIGTERGALLGLIRTQELLTARKLDGAQQFFTRAIDFGFSKTAEESLRFWGRDRILSDVVWVIRKFQPDVILLRFSGTPADGHGQHQASAILGKEAFTAAADPARFPEQLMYVKPWQAKRLVRIARGNEKEDGARVTVDTGSYSALLGKSFEEIGALSRSMHRSQGMGAPQRKGSVLTNLMAIGGTAARNDVLEGVPKTWADIEGGAEVARLFAEATAQFDPLQPTRSVEPLLRARPLLAKLQNPRAQRALADLDETIALLAGIWVDLSSSSAVTTPGSTVPLTVSALNRSSLAVEWTRVTFEGPGGVDDSGVAVSLPANKLVSRKPSWKVPESIGPTEPYWLERPPKDAVYNVTNPQLIGTPDALAVLQARFRLRVGNEEIELVRPLRNRYVDRVYGELTRPEVVAPPAVLRLAEEALVFPNPDTRAVNVEVMSNAAGVEGAARLDAPQGWRVEPASVPFRLARKGQSQTVRFQVTPPTGKSTGELKAVAKLPTGEVSLSMAVVAYPHIPTQTTFPAASVRVVRSDVKVLARRIGYIMGAGDVVPDALAQLGLEVELLDEVALAQKELGVYDAIVAGVRAYNTREDLKAHRERLMRYVENGGTYIVQYNTVESDERLGEIGPYPLTIGRDRVSVEDAPVRVLKPEHPLLQAPNKISQEDFEGWVQERGLYFASKWDPHYETLLSSNDPGEPPRDGGLLVAKYGKGTFVYTGYSWFRQLPAGVPGAYRIFANLLSASKLRQ